VNKEAERAAKPPRDGEESSRQDNPTASRFELTLAEADQHTEAQAHCDVADLPAQTPTESC